MPVNEDEPESKIQREIRLHPERFDYADVPSVELSKTQLDFIEQVRHRMIPSGLEVSKRGK